MQNKIKKTSKKQLSFVEKKKKKYEKREGIDEWDTDTFIHYTSIRFLF